MKGLWLYGPTESGFALGVRKRPVRSAPRKAPRRRGYRPGRRVFKGATGFSKRRLSPMAMVPVFWRYLYPGAFEPLAPIDPPAGLPSAGEYDPAFLGLDYDQRTEIPLEELHQFLRDEVVNDPLWSEWAEACAETGEPAAHPLYEVHDGGETMFEDLAARFGLPEEWAGLDEEEQNEKLVVYFDLLADVVNGLSPDDLRGAFEFGYNDSGAFGLWYYECRGEEAA